MTRPGVLLDRDGTIIVDSGYVGAISDVVFLEGAVEAIARLNAAGIPVAVVTNQSAVARGFFELEDVEQVHKHMAAELARGGAYVDAWFFCPYHPDGIVAPFARVSSDRKPGPGMALAAAETLGLDLSASWVVGDSDSDVGMARAVGAQPFLVLQTGQSTAPDVVTVTGLAAAVDIILSDHAERSIQPAVPRTAFPGRRYAEASSFAADYAGELSRAMATLDSPQLDAAARLLNAAYDRGATVFSCGNGGSASIANHFQCDHVKGVRGGTGLLTHVQSLSANVEILSAIANDNGYDGVFDFQLESLARPGDVLVAVSSSGRSPNIVRALEWCAKNGLESVALTGFTGGRARELATVSVHVDSFNYGVIEDAHQACMHLLAQYVRQSRMSAADVVSAVF
ncbi:HAD-IIIA family hydrolase [Pedococcus sp. 5OH_020]|uniref:HAD-IIIA family hydrolase n=1 Tax=Pedococcus sp. 5OH_020 TaxID=2989814 RepID=UPI0022E9B4D7|nr:HAD-IIIA family hydrolase [Pedococcus sp. 5OH_020]